VKYFISPVVKSPNDLNVITAHGSGITWGAQSMIPFAVVPDWYENYWYSKSDAKARSDRRILTRIVLPVALVSFAYLVGSNL
jgi:hypothetical protein